MTDLTTLPIDADSTQLILITADDVLTAQLNQDAQQHLDFKDNLEDFYIKVFVAEQDIQVSSVPVYKRSKQAHIGGSAIHSLFMNYKGRLRILRSSRAWFNSDMSNKYSIAGRLF